MTHITHNGLTLDAAQKTVDNWINSTGNGYFPPLTNLAMLTEEVGEVAHIMARCFGAQVPKPGDSISKQALADEMADVLWVLMALANQTGVNLNDAFVNNLAKKNIRDKERFVHKKDVATLSND